jgi:hypothetical protein
MHLSTTINAGRQAYHPLVLIERFLRDRESIWQQIYGEHQLDALVAQMLACSSAAFACYGLVLGLSHSPLQALASAIKLPILFLLALAICLPSLYLSNLVFGGRLTARQVFALALTAITVTSVFTLAFVPISFFFLITAQGYAFFLLLNVTILATTSLVGLQYLVAGVRRLNALAAADRRTDEASGEMDEKSKTPATPLAKVSLLYVWLMLYAFVGTQLGWTLRPFFGTPGMPFQLFRAVEGNFYGSILQLLFGLP